MTQLKPEPVTAAMLGQDMARAWSATQARRFDDAIRICDDVLSAAPGLAEALALKGALRAELGDAANAALLLERAIAANRDVASWHLKLSGIYRGLYRLAEAVRSAQAAVDLNPNDPALLVDLALALVELGDPDQASLCLLRAIGNAPNDPAAHITLGETLLARGEMDAGWLEYELGNRLKSAGGPLSSMTSPAWNGMRMPGPLLLVADQGYGDCIQFARFIPLAARRCAELILACPPELAPLLCPIDRVASCHLRWEDIPGHRAHARLSSLPYLLRVRLDEVHPEPAAYLRAPPERVAFWKRRLDAQLAPGKRIGIAWSGRPTHSNDRRRSLRLAMLAPLLRQANVRWVSLQTPLPATEVEEFESWKGLDLSRDLHDFGETAAVIANLDLVITVDTAVGHLAGALDRPVWLMLPRPSDWRWMLDRADTPWYPSMRLFRQTVPGDWDMVIAAVGEALHAVL